MPNFKSDLQEAMDLVVSDLQDKMDNLLLKSLKQCVILHWLRLVKNSARFW